MIDDFKSVELFEGKNLSDLFKEIYENSASKRTQIKGLIESLGPLIQGIGDATILVPLIKEYLDIGVKNDEQLIKLAQIVQRLNNDKKPTGGMDDVWASFANALEDDKTNAADLEKVSEEADKALDEVQHRV